MSICIIIPETSVQVQSLDGWAGRCSLSSVDTDSIPMLEANPDVYLEEEFDRAHSGNGDEL